MNELGLLARISRRLRRRCPLSPVDEEAFQDYDQIGEE